MAAILRLVMADPATARSFLEAAAQQGGEAAMAASVAYGRNCGFESGPGLSAPTGERATRASRALGA